MRVIHPNDVNGWRGEWSRVASQQQDGIEGEIWQNVSGQAIAVGGAAIPDGGLVAIMARACGPWEAFRIEETKGLQKREL